MSLRVGTVEALDDPSSPQSKAAAWILEECDATIPIDPCTESQLILNEQRYALAVMYFSLGGDTWNAGSNPSLDKSAPEGQWMSGLNYCDWGTEISGANGSYNQLVCDDFGNVLNLNLRTYCFLCCVFQLLLLLLETNPNNTLFFVDCLPLQLHTHICTNRIQQHDWTNPTRNRCTNLHDIVHFLLQCTIGTNPNVPWSNCTT